MAFFTGTGEASTIGSLSAGTNVIGALVADQTVDVNKIAGTDTAVGSGPSTAGTQRVILSTDTQVTPQGNVAHDAVDSGSPLKQGLFAADPVSLPAAVQAGDRVNAAGSLNGEQYAYLSRYISGEDSSGNNLMQMAQKPLAVSTYTASRDSSAALEASSISKASAGNLYEAFGVISATAPTAMYYIQFLDSATLTADGAVTHLITPVPVNHVNGVDSSFDTGRFDFGVAAANGIVIVLSTTLVTKTIAGAYLFATVTYK